MSTCWEILHLAPTPDTRAIKRAYAVLLKTTRPEDDPQGFQTLREALETALQLAPYVEDATAEPAPFDTLEIASIEVYEADADTDTPVEEGAAPEPTQSEPTPHWQAQIQAWTDELMQLNEGDSSEPIIARFEAILVEPLLQLPAVSSAFQCSLLHACGETRAMFYPFVRHVALHYRWISDPDATALAEASALTDLRRGILHAEAEQTVLIALNDSVEEGWHYLTQLRQGALLFSFDNRDFFEGILVEHTLHHDEIPVTWLRQLYDGMGWSTDFNHLVRHNAHAWEVFEQRLYSGERRAYIADVLAGKVKHEVVTLRRLNRLKTRFNPIGFYMSSFGEDATQKQAMFNVIEWLEEYAPDALAEMDPKTVSAWRKLVAQKNSSAVGWTIIVLVYIGMMMLKAYFATKR